MTVIEFAEERLNESCLNDDDEAVLYWRAHLDGARAQKKEVQCEELVKRTKADLTLMRKLKTLDYYAYRIEIARRQKTGAFRSARPKGVIK